METLNRPFITAKRAMCLSAGSNRASVSSFITSWSFREPLRVFIFHFNLWMFIAHVGFEFKVVSIHISGLAYAKQCLVVFCSFSFLYFSVVHTCWCCNTVNLPPSLFTCLTFWLIFYIYRQEGNCFPGIASSRKRRSPHPVHNAFWRRSGVSESRSYREPYVIAHSISYAEAVRIL